ncbi:MAG: 5'-Nucleotidase domain protein [Bacteroidetes bacterium]|nr:5'-Nucleotidase domain protein [Bacteroidota bacterium]
MMIARIIALLGYLSLPLAHFTFVVNSNCANAQTILWQAEQRITFDTNYNYTPRIFAKGDTLHLFWKRGDLMYLRSTNLGATWSSPLNLYTGRPGNAGSTNGIAMSGRYLYHVWVSCDTCRGTDYWVTFRRSTNSGESFEPYRLLYLGSSGSIAASDSFVVFASRTSTLSGLLQVSDDFAQSWQSKALAYRDFQEVFLKNEVLHLFQPAIGTSRFEISHSFSTNLGTNWSSEQLLSTNDDMISYRYSIAGDSDSLVSLVWMDGKYGSTSGFSTSVLFRRSLNGGRTWEPEQLLTSLPSALFPRISQRGSMIAVVWENETQPFRGISFRLSPDRGQTWLPEFPVSDSSIQAGGPGVFVDGSNIHVVWSDSRTGRPQIFYRRGIHGTTNVPLEAKQPERITLLANYPNPFNPTTTIRFAIPVGTYGHTSLRVYDVLGREVRTLVNENLKAGSYETTFDARGLASGVYFYRLQARPSSSSVGGQAGEFVSVKRLLLLK